MQETMGSADIKSEAKAASIDSEWPEFREWYALSMEEERLYNVEPTPTNLVEQLDKIDAVRGPLQAAMVARQPRGIVQSAILSMIALRWSERVKSDHGVYRSFELGYQSAFSNGHAAEFALTEGVVRLALQHDLLPGIVVYDKTGAAISSAA